MERVQLIGISGKAGSGKDFVGGILAGAGWSRFSLAWPMKNEGLGIGFSFEEMHVTKPPASRVWLQHRGTEDGWQKYGSGYWLKIAEGWIRCLDYRRVYVPDIRFPHEAEWIRSHGGNLIRLEGRGGLKGEAGQHLSETALDAWTDWDVVVDNGPGATLNDLKRQLNRFLRRACVRPQEEWLALK